MPVRLLRALGGPDLFEKIVDDGPEYFRLLAELFRGPEHVLCGGTGFRGRLGNAGDIRGNFLGAGAACWTLWAISFVDAPCSFTASEMDVAMPLTCSIVWPIPPIAFTALPVAVWISEIWEAISSVAFAVWSARDLTSEATTAKPLPASPARAASMVALSASRFVWLAISLIRLTISPIFSAAFARVRTSWLVRSASVTASPVILELSFTWRAISEIDEESSSAAAATVWTLAVACSEAAATAVVWLLVCSAVRDMVSAEDCILVAASLNTPRICETFSSKSRDRSVM
jgi:hypothetical protein